jgi:scyllo-inositol 2-dehydrogenase (NADP+)
MSSPIKVGIAGLGRSGWNIHANTFKHLPEHYQVVAAMDFDAARRQEAADTFGAATYDSFDDLIANPDVEAIVVATPNFLHKDHVIAALNAGKHAICEKPFGATAADADEMIEAANKAGKFAAPFQNRRYETHFEKVREVISSGILGDIHLIRLNVHGFNRRWDWQTLQEFGGGQITNWGPHIIDHALQLLGLEDNAPDPELWCDLRNVLSSGDADDHVIIVLRAPNSPVVEIEISSAIAYPQERWLVAGKSGGLRGNTNSLEWKWVDWSQAEERPVERVPTPGRSYNSEKLEWQTESWEGSNSDALLNERFYKAFYDSVRNGKPLDITPASVRRQIWVIETAKRLGGF